MGKYKVEEIYRDKIYPADQREWLLEYTKDHKDFKRFCAQELGDK